MTRPSRVEPGFGPPSPLLPRVSEGLNRRVDPAMIRVLVVARSPLHRDGLGHVLEHHPRILVVGRSSTARDALVVLARERPRIALLQLSGARDIPLVRALSNRACATKLVGIAEAISEDTMIDALESGLSALIGPDAGLVELVDAFEAVGRGEFPCSPRTAALLQRRLQELALSRSASAGGRLTPREADIMALVGEGLSNSQIARELTLELSTVKNHLHNIFEKLDVHTRAEAAARLRDAGQIRKGI